jgi:hypothetical protein
MLGLAACSASVACGVNSGKWNANLGNSSGGGSGGSSGSNSAGQNMNDAAPPPKVVGKCDGLAAVGMFEDITPAMAMPSLTMNGITNVMVDPVHAGTVFVGTDHSGLLKSTDCGSTWTKMNTGTNGAVLDSGILWSIAIDPVFPNYIYAGSLYGSNLSLFVSSDGGVNFDSAFAAGGNIASTVPMTFYQECGLEPGHGNHVIISFHIDCMGQWGAGCMAESMDYGKDWRLFSGPLMNWKEGAGPYILGPTTWLLGSEGDGLFVTSNSGGTWTKVGPGANRQMYQTQDKKAYYLPSDYGIQRSTDGGMTWTLIPNSPKTFGIVGDGKNIYTSLRNSNSDQLPYYSSPESDGMTWTQMTDTPKMAHGAHDQAYDPDHHLMYSANTSSGFWRVVTP